MGKRADFMKYLENHKKFSRAVEQNKEKKPEIFFEVYVILQKSEFKNFVTEAADRYLKSICEPGSPVGAIAAQSIGEHR
eukprot:UN07355